MRSFVSLFAGTALLAAALPGVSLAQNMMSLNITKSGDSVNSQTLRLPLSKSAIVELGHPAADVIISDPAVADVFVQTSKRFIFRGLEAGSTNAFIFDEHGNQLLNLEIIVERDVAELEALIADIVPAARVKVKGSEGSVILSGRVANMAEADTVIQIANSYMAGTGGNEVVNLLTVDANDQVMLQVRVVEMRRSVAKQLGVNFGSDATFGQLDEDEIQNVIVDSTSSLGVTGGLDLNYDFGKLTDDAFNIDVALEALEGVGVVRTLAEPNLTTVSGEAANFLAGGEFPVPSETDDQGRVQVTFREFGVGLGFTPFVLSEDRISLRMSLEVSEISPEIAVGNVPGLTSRKVESVVELPSGRSMMIAGLIQSETRQILEGVPGAKDIPYLGALFRSRDFANDETELVVIVTPYLVGPSNLAELRTPADGFANPSDLESNLFGKLNAIYGTRGRPERGQGYNAPVGFIEE